MWETREHILAVQDNFCQYFFFQNTVLFKAPLRAPNEVKSQYQQLLPGKHAIIKISQHRHGTGPSYYLNLVITT